MQDDDDDDGDGDNDNNDDDANQMPSDDLEFILSSGRDGSVGDNNDSDDGNETKIYGIGDDDEDDAVLIQQHKGVEKQ